jgi:23S rRNA (pseudouridine1915-N3)-methyltransferase
LDVKIFVYFIGKPRDQQANALVAEYLKRTSRYAPAEAREVKPNALDFLDRHPSAYKIFLDPAGKQIDSPRFATLLGKLEDEGRDLVFLLGGHDGLSDPQRQRADLLLSLSAMTWPHELARAMLAEQIYRALATLRGHPYPR